MFSNLTSKITNIFKKITHRGRLTENNIEKTLKKIKYAFLEADVSLSVIESFLSKIKKKSIGKILNKSLTPGQELISIVKDELINIMGNKTSSLNFSKKNPTIFLIIGLQGSGKTTSLSKIAYKLSKKKRVMVVSTDVYRPAAIQQLKVLLEKTKIFFLPSFNNQTPLEITKNALKKAKEKNFEILIIDTSGRLHNNVEMMKELKEIQELSCPNETFFIIDSLTGQDAINSIKEFQKKIKISSIILSKLDSDTRGGVALSVKFLTNIPIKFIGIGEKINDLSEFYPERIANRILGMGDVLSFIEEIKNKIKRKEISSMKSSFKKNKKFDLNDFYEQIRQVKKIGNIESLLNKLPTNIYSSNSFLSNINNNTLKNIESIINSMTKKEKENPKIIKGSRKKRISIGSGVTIQEINNGLKKFEQVKKLVKKIKTNGISRIFENIQKYIN